jgi:Lrp/AsnC family transcriptional regulator, leucine-responsive regulatory protein
MPDKPADRRIKTTEECAMDEKDQFLLSLLRKNARSSLVALSRDLGLSRSATQERLGRLISSGVVTGFTIIEGQASTARQTAHLIVRFAPGANCAQVVPRLRQIPLLSVIHAIAGEIDLMIRVDAPDLAAMESTRAKVAATPGIADVTTLMTLDRHLG